MSTITDLLVPIARAGLTWLSRRALPQTAGTLTLSGLTAPVEVLRDRWGIPHIYAAHLHDLLFAQGFVHAQDRLWQMELNRRTAQGRLSELFGAIALDTDRTSRTFGFNRLVRADLANASNEFREALQAYTAGVNAFLTQPGLRLPVEFTLLNHRPEPWTAEDSAVFSRVMIWQLSHAWYSEIIRAQIIQKVGAERAAELEIHYPKDNPTVLPKGIEFNSLEPNGTLQSAPGPFLQRGQGSNAWLVSSDKSATGHPLLCNDMHLALGQPGLWYENHLVCGDFQVTGVSLPGLPLVLVGHNAHIAWGMTLAFTDAEDLFVERFDPQNPHRYQSGDEWLEAEVIAEAIRVKGRPTAHIENVLVTRHGPVISDVVSYHEQRVAVNSMALRPSPALQGWIMLNRAANWDEFVAAMRLIEAPQLNVAYADTDGNIGYWVTGKVPIRAKGDGSIPVPGWTSEYEWVGEVPFEAMPHAINPSAGYLVHTNNRVVTDDYPFFLGNVWMNGYRARRIVDVIESKVKITPKDCRDLQVDYTCLPGLEFVARLQNLDLSDPDVRLAVERLRDWDGNLNPESVAGTIYEVTRYTLIRNLLEPALGQELAFRLMGKGFHPILLASHEFYGHDTVTMLRLLDAPDSWWIQQAGGRETVLLRSLRQAVEWLRKELGRDVERWQWGRLHHAIFPHPLGMQKPLDKVFNRGPVPIGGDADTPCQTAMHPHDPYDNKAWAPSFRQIVDMGNFDASQVISPSGQSGQLGSLHYDDLLQPWLKGEYHPMLWDKAIVEKEAKERLTILPK